MRECVVYTCMWVHKYAHAKAREWFLRSSTALWLNPLRQGLSLSIFFLPKLEAPIILCLPLPQFCFMGAEIQTHAFF